MLLSGQQQGSAEWVEGKNQRKDSKEAGWAEGLGGHLKKRGTARGDRGRNRTRQEGGIEKGAGVKRVTS